jgi:hypothetical protein
MVAARTTCAKLQSTQERDLSDAAGEQFVMHMYIDIRFIGRVLDRKNKKEHDCYKSKHEMNVYYLP